MCMNEDAAEKLPEDMPTCLCNLYFGLQPENTWLPEWGYSRTTKKFILYCPNCKYQVGPFDNKPAAIASWALLNRHGDEHVYSNWAKYYAAHYPVPEYLTQYLRQERA